MAAHRTLPPSAGDSRFKMIDVGEKPPTRRRAVACGKIIVGKEAFTRIREQSLPKGDVLALAEVAGIMAAKNASNWIPLCHPLALETVRISFEFQESDSSILARCEAIATAKTGVEMEALAGVNAALLSIYDLTKGVNAALWISDIHLETKEGGKSGFWSHPKINAETQPAAQALASGNRLEGLKCAVITVSDRCSRGEAQDRSGPAIRELLKKEGAEIIGEKLVADEVAQIAEAISNFALEQEAEIILTTGGTGLSARDVTPEALCKLNGRVVPGIGELLRSEGSHKTPMAWISRSEAVQIGKALVIALPGSEKAVREGVASLLPILKHAHLMILGGGH